MDVEKGVLGDAWKHVPGTQQVEALARNVDYDTRGHSMLLWDLSEDGELKLGNLQTKIICNVIRPYISKWWMDQLSRFMNTHAAQGIKRLRKWTLSEDKYSSLPALLIDIEFMTLDYSDSLKKNPMYRQIHEAKRSDKKKKVGVVHVSNIPKTLADSEVDGDYHRRGATICFAYKGPEKMKEKLCRAVALELKSTLHFNKKIVDMKGFLEKKPTGKLTPAEKKKQKEAEAKFAEQELRVNIALAGNKRTKNRKRIALQDEGRRLEREGRLHLDKTGAAPMPQNTE
eukprot:scaffold42800_cov160-Amphora_coffeaeformis.AAC.1